ncbi:hypothetical protein P12x_004513 [Tundrisphaera lichenicola]|uniref:hypothetical protein n=1 Tax=Tundrisphaera lichenicola TaxID=2029860 RepID=UPI003EBDBA55
MHPIKPNGASRKSFASVTVMLAVTLALPGLVSAGDDPRPPDPSKVPVVEPALLEAPDLETDAAFAGTWQLVAKSGDRGGTKVGDRLVVEEEFIWWGPDEGASVWGWHQPGPFRGQINGFPPYVNWAPTRTQASPWPIIELSRGPSPRLQRSKAIYHLRGDLLWLAFPVGGIRMPADFATVEDRDVEVWRRIAPPVVRLEPESDLNGRWRLVSVKFDERGGPGPPANTLVPEHLIGTMGPTWFLCGKEGTVFEVQGGAWRPEGRTAGEKNGPMSWTATRVMQLPRRVYIRRTPEPRPAGVPAEETGTYRVWEKSILIAKFPQQWLDKHRDGVTHLVSGDRIERYERNIAP